VTSSDAPINQSRRDFLKTLLQKGKSVIIWVGAGALGGGVAKFSGPFSDQIGPFAEYIAHERLGFQPPISKSAQYLAKSLLFGTGDELSVVHSEGNPNAPDAGITFPTKFLGDRLKGILMAAERFKDAKTIRVHEFSGNILCLGGPVANEITRQVMGLDGSFKLASAEADGVSLSFPCVLEYDASVSAIKDGVYRLGQRGPIPVWQFRVPTGSLRPEVRNGKLLSDYLHIASIPNVLSTRAYDGKRRITMAFGSCGAGTRSLAALFDMEKLMEEILEKTNKMQGWHVIIPVDRIKEDGETPLSLASVPTIYEIVGNFGRVAEAVTREASIVANP
jgi:hypothetical protein